MTIKQLIEKLSTLDPTLEVYIRGYEDGYDDVVMFEPVTVCKNFNTEWYYGKHQPIDGLHISAADLSAYQITNGIFLT